MQTIERGGYSRDEILEVLHAKHSTRNVRFRYDLLDRNEYFIKTLDTVVSGEVSMQAFSTIKRTAKFKIKEQYVPERVDSVELNKRKYYDVTADWQEAGWTYTNVRMRSDGSGIEFDTQSSLFGDDFETPYDVDGGYTPWGEWNSAATTLEQVTGITGTYAQQITRGSSVAGGSWGLQTDTKDKVTSLVTGEKIYLSFYYKTLANTTPTTAFVPTYTYLLMSAGSNLTVGSNYVITDVGGNWYRMDCTFTIPSGNAGASAGILIGTTGGTATTDRLIVDRVFLGRIQPKFTAEAISPVFSLVVDDIEAIQALATRTQFDYTQYNDGNVASGSTYPNPYPQFYTRISYDKGVTWQPWKLAAGSGNALQDMLYGVDFSDFRFQFKVTAVHTVASNANFITGYFNLYVYYDKYYIVPETTEIDYLSDRIKPYMEVRMPDGNWIEFPLGVFLLNTPTRHDEVNMVYRDIEAYDGLVVLDDDKFTSSFLASGKYTDMIVNILEGAGITKYNIEASSAIMGASIEFKTGTSKLEAVNTLLAALNYTPLWVDANGYYTSSPYVSPSDRAADYDYLDNDLSVTYNGMEEELDLFAVPNVWVCVQSNPEKTPLTRTKTNSDPKSPTSTANVGRSIVDFREVNDIADQATLNAYVDRIAFESSQVFGKLKFKTALMPFHEYADVIRVKYDGLKIDDKFSETSWTMKLQAGGEMEHEVRKVVTV